MLLIILTSILFSGGCKDENEVGLNLLPTGDQLGTVFSDSTYVLTTTVTEDSLKSDELSLQIIGSDRDPVFGLSTASVYTQVNLVGTPSFGVLPVADSLVLILTYAGYHGDTTSSQTINVFRLNEDIHIDSSYYSSKTFGFDPSALGTLSFTPHPNTVDSPETVAHIRIPLSIALADSLVALNGLPEFSSNANWIAYFKGLYLEATDATGQGAISYFNFISSKMTLYFHDTTNTAKNYNFSIAGARVNHFSHDFTGSPVGNQLNNPAFNDSVNYVQAMSGVKTKISFPYLKHFLDSGSIVVNRAELKIEGVMPIVIPYSLPAKLILVTTDNSGTSIFPIDYYESATYYGGFLNTDGYTYTFNIGRQLQLYLNGAIHNADFELVISGSGVLGNRLILRSGINPNSRMKLSFFYTKLY